MYKKYHETEV